MDASLQLSGCQVWSAFPVYTQCSFLCSLACSHEGSHNCACKSESSGGGALGVRRQLTIRLSATCQCTEALPDGDCAVMKEPSRRHARPGRRL